MILVGGFLQPDPWLLVVTHPGYDPDPPDPGPLSGPRGIRVLRRIPRALDRPDRCSHTVGASTSAGMSFGGPPPGARGAMVRTNHRAVHPLHPLTAVEKAAVNRDSLSTSSPRAIH